MSGWGCSSVVKYLCGEVMDLVFSMVKTKKTKTSMGSSPILKIFTIMRDISFLLTLSTRILHKHILVPVGFDCPSVYS